MFSLLVAAMVILRRQDKVVLYNNYPEYLLLALWRCLLRSSAVIDIEDGPSSRDRSIIGRLVEWTYPLFRLICADRYLIVSNQLGRDLGLRKFLPVYGVADGFGDDKVNPPRLTTSPIRVGFGGSIMHDTGYDLFCEAVRLLALAPDVPPIHFLISGLFVSGAFDTLVADTESARNIQITVFGDLDRSAYRALADTLDVGLCLKLPSTQLGKTTFPSKVIEIAALGSLLMSTRVSDVPFVFDEDSAFLLKSERAVDLADALADVASNPAQFVARAANGRLLVRDGFAAQRVGTAIMSFLES